MVANTGLPRSGNQSLHEKTHLRLSLFNMETLLPSEKSQTNNNLLTGQSWARSLRMVDFATIAQPPMDIDSDSDSLEDMSLHDPMDWEDSPGSFNDIFANVISSMANLSVSCDGMDIVESDSESLLRALVSSMANLSVSDPLCASGGSCSIVDEHGRLVRRSLRLAANDGSTRGSFLLPSGDGRYLRRSARLRR